VKLSELDLIRFWSKIDVRGPEECWPWKATVNRSGHGRFFLNGKLESAHRVAFFIHHGKLPASCSCHHCDNPPCCNFKHLFDGTKSENAIDSVKKGRWHRFHKDINIGTKNGSNKLSEDQVLAIFNDPRSQKKIAASYFVCAGSVQQIKEGKKWAWLTGKQKESA
jgi:hypothetical protein